MVARTHSGTSSRHSSSGGNKGMFASSTTSVASSKSHASADRHDQHHDNNNHDHRDDSETRVRHFSQYAKIDQAILNMKASLGRFTRANDRRMVLRTLKDVKYLKALPVESRPPPMVDLEELEMEVAKENLVLNGQAFHRKTKYGRTSTDFLHVLHELCYQICENASGKPTSLTHSSNVSVGAHSTAISTAAMAMSPDTLYYDLLCRLARTITSADCFAKLNDVLGSQDLILMNSSAERKPKSKKNSKGVVVTKSDEMSAIPPIELNIFEEGGNIHAQIITTLGYGLYRKLDVTTGRPWIKMQGELNERMNFSTGAQVRHVTLLWPDMYV